MKCPAITVLHFLTFIFTVHYSVAQLQDLADKGHEALKTSVKQFKEFTELLSSDGLKIALVSTAVSTLAKTLSLAALGIIIDACLKNRIEREMKKQFMLMHERFDELEDKLGRFSKKFESQRAYVEYKKEILDKKRALQAAGKDLAECPDGRVLEQFKATCKKYEPLTLINTLTHLLQPNHLGLSTVLDAFYTDSNYNRYEIHKHVFFVLVDLIEIGMMADLCNHNSSSKAISTFVTDKVQAAAEIIIGQLKKLDQRLDNEFHVQAQKELRELIQKQGEKNADAAAIVSNMTAKYTWLGFYVNIFKEKRSNNSAYGKVYDGNRTYFIELHGKDQASAFMAWTDKKNANANVPLMLKAKNMLDAAVKDKVCSGSSKELIENLEKRPEFSALKPKWIFAVRRPMDKELSKQNAHGAVLDFMYCEGVFKNLDGQVRYKQVIIVGFA